MPGHDGGERRQPHQLLVSDGDDDNSSHSVVPTIPTTHTAKLLLVRVKMHLTRRTLSFKDAKGKEVEVPAND